MVVGLERHHYYCYYHYLDTRSDHTPTQEKENKKIEQDEIGLDWDKKEMEGSYSS